MMCKRFSQLVAPSISCFSALRTITTTATTTTSSSSSRRFSAAASACAAASRGYYRANRHEGLKFTLTALIDRCSREKPVDCEKVEKLHLMMKDLAVFPDSRTFSSLIKAHLNATPPRIEMALAKLKEAEESGNADQSVYSHMLKGFARDPEGAEWLVDRMKQKGVSPNETIYFQLARTLLLSDPAPRWERIKEIVEETEAQGMDGQNLCHRLFKAVKYSEKCGSLLEETMQKLGIEHQPL